MKDIISIDYQLFLDEVKLIDFETKHSLSDADIIICKPYIAIPYGYHSSYRGKTSYNLDVSSKIKDFAIHWNKEINSALDAGKNIFIFLNEIQDFYLDTGRRDTSGTGKNQKVTNIVENFHNYKILPFNLEIHNSKGEKIVIKNNLVKTFVENFKNILSYEAYIESKDVEIHPLIYNKTQDKIISGIIKHKNGNIIFLPFIQPDSEEFYNDKDEFTDEGVKHQRKLLNSILEIDKSLSSSIEKSPKPDWLEDEKYKLIQVEIIKKEIDNKYASIKKIEDEIHSLETNRDSEESLLDLIFETGKQLENAVIKALKILGFEAENFDNGVLELDQVIISPEKIRYIGECEGKDSKAIDISKFRQLLDSLIEDFQREEIDEKAFGLLFGNPFRNTKIEERTDYFTTKCLKGAEREKIGLIRTTDLFFICKYLSENKNEKFKKQCREQIFKGLGGIIKFPELPKK
ncbi:hypothetical protein [Chryseobacterium aureum]|uniref:hypothetical protein n=1 Tax=Chryseobacterium aureum TaxID=2497456 RepID=UPI000F898A46|nr:hypothetical protein [Chryseobacterium aureum]